MKFKTIRALKLCIKLHRVGYLCTRKKQNFLKKTAKVPKTGPRRLARAMHGRGVVAKR